MILWVIRGAAAAFIAMCAENGPGEWYFGDDPCGF